MSTSSSLAQYSYHLLSLLWSCVHHLLYTISWMKILQLSVVYLSLSYHLWFLFAHVFIFFFLLSLEWRSFIFQWYIDLLLIIYYLFFDHVFIIFYILSLFFVWVFRGSCFIGIWERNLFIWFWPSTSWISCLWLINADSLSPTNSHLSQGYLISTLVDFLCLFSKVCVLVPNLHKSQWYL